VSLGSIVLLVKLQAAKANGFADEGREVLHIYQSSGAKSALFQRCARFF
jgi:hypothetical protein